MFATIVLLALVDQDKDEDGPWWRWRTGAEGYLCVVKRGTCGSTMRLSCSYVLREGSLELYKNCESSLSVAKNSGDVCGGKG